MALSECDTCLFVGYHTILVVYISDGLLFSKQYQYVDAVVEEIHDQKFELEYKDQSITGFLSLVVLAYHGKIPSLRPPQESLPAPLGYDLYASKSSSAACKIQK